MKSTNVELTTKPAIVGNNVLGAVYNNKISNYKLREGEMYCISCNQVIKKINLNRHDNSLKHENAVMTFVKRMKLNCA